MNALVLTSSANREIKSMDFSAVIAGPRQQQRRRPQVPHAGIAVVAERNLRVRRHLRKVGRVVAVVVVFGRRDHRGDAVGETVPGGKRALERGGVFVPVRRRRCEHERHDPRFFVQDRRGRHKQRLGGAVVVVRAVVAVVVQRRDVVDGAQLCVLAAPQRRFDDLLRDAGASHRRDRVGHPL
jgi:hypothetical protein